MKKRHIIRTLSVCVALLLLSACRQEQDGLAVADESAASVQVSFTLTTASGNASTRVGTDEPGTGYENYIDITNNNFRFLLFDKDNKTFVYSFTPQSVTPAGASGEYAQTYEVEGEMPEEYADFNYKVVVLANWPTYPSENDLTGKTIQDICLAYTYNYTDSFVPSESQLIPFYGCSYHKHHTSPGYFYQPWHHRLVACPMQGRSEVQCQWFYADRSHIASVFHPRNVRAAGCIQQYGKLGRERTNSFACYRCGK